MKNMFLAEAYKILEGVEDDLIFKLTEDQENSIRDLINLNDYNTELELRTLRNYLVMMISSTEDLTNFKKNRMLITITTTIIDNKLFKIGAAV